MLYDDMGSRTLRKKDLKQFKDKGGHAKPSSFQIALNQFKNE